MVWGFIMGVKVLGSTLGAMARPVGRYMSTIRCWIFLGSAAMALLCQLIADQGQITSGQCRLVYESMKL